MKKAGQLAALVLAAVAFWAINPHRGDARLIGTNPTGASADVWCVGGRAYANTAVLTTEVCVDASGNVIPTTTGTGSLGTSSLKWLNLFLSGNASIAGTAAVTGTSSFTGNVGISTAAATYSELTVVAALASSTGTVVQAAPSNTADVFEARLDGPITVFSVTPNGYMKARARTLAAIQGATPVAADLGGQVICTDCAAIYSICVATGATVQGFRLGSSGTAECK